MEAQDRQRKPTAPRKQASDGMRAHPMVQRALELFDGDMIEVRGVPSQEVSHVA
jgi:hypothetical protein